MIERIRILKNAEYNAWDTFITGCPQGTLFHKSYWLEASGEEFRIYGYFKGEELVAGLPIACGTLGLGIKRGFHPPLTPYLGVVFKESQAKYVKQISDEKEISTTIATQIKEDFSSISFNFAPSFTDLQPFIWEGFSSGVRYTYLLELNDLGDIWNNMDGRKRNHIKRAEKDGIYVESGGDFDQMFALVEKTFERQEKKAYFRSIAHKYNEALSQRGQCISFVARNKAEEAIASVYIVWDEKRSYQLLAGYDPIKVHNGASALAIWKAIQFTKEELGLNQYDFEGSMIPPVEQFFRKFGGQLTPYYSVSWSKPSVKSILYARRLGGAGLRKLKLR